MPWSFFNSNGQRLSSAVTSINVLDIDGATDIGAAIVDADLFIIDDGAGGANRKTAASRLKTYIGSTLTSKVVQGTRAASAGASTQEVDTAGFAPVAAIILAIEDGTQAVAIGMVDSSDNRASIYGQTQGSYPNIWNEHASGFQVRDGSDYSNGVMTLTSDGVDIVWTLNNSGVDVTWKILFFG